ncbi:MAG: 1-acyl-sn-glycerol-3-phosphate acyltransferase [Candidatus Wallbacteria bacterium]|nr:1-acyl-sn-glycerol-3-phosphate acyltransferase [Candidatus Wallbacteria bacterium]
MTQIHFELARFLSRVVFTAMNIRCTLRGEENLPKDDAPVVLALNHASILDPPLVWAVCPRPIYFVTKAEFHKVPVFGTASARVGNIGIRRGQMDRGAITRSIDYVTRLRRSIGVFIEGTRSPDGELRPGKNGSALLVLKTGAPVVPAYIGGTFDVWPRHALLPGWRRELTLTLGPVLRYPREDEHPGKERLAQIAAEITAAIARLKPGTL